MEIQVISPPHAGNEVIFVRVETIIRLNVVVKPTIPELPIQWDCLKIPKTMSVRACIPIGLREPLYFSLEVRGASSNETYKLVCSQCLQRKSRRGLDIVDFDATEDLVGLEDGTARICFRLKCYPHCHRKIDKEYKSVLLHQLQRLSLLGHRIDAILSDSNAQVLSRVTIPKLFKVVGHRSPTHNGNRGRPRKNNRPDHATQCPTSEPTASTLLMF